MPLQYCRGMVFFGLGVAKNSKTVRKDQDPNFRPTLHFSLGEVVSMGDRQIDYPFAVVTPLGNIENQLVNVFPTDTFVLGDIKLSKDTIVVVPHRTDTSNIPEGVPIVKYSKKQGLKNAVDQVVQQGGGWSVTLPDNFDQGLPAMVHGFDINSRLFFKNLLERHSHLSYGTHVTSEIGQAGIFGLIDQMLLSITGQYINDEPPLPPLSNKKNETVLAVIRFYLQKLDRVIADSNLPDVAKKAYQAKKD